MNSIPLVVIYGSVEGLVESGGVSEVGHQIDTHLWDVSFSVTERNHIVLCLSSGIFEDWINKNVVNSSLMLRGGLTLYISEFVSLSLNPFFESSFRILCIGSRGLWTEYCRIS